MARVSVDPEELRRFSKDLQKFNNELDQMLSKLNSRANELARTWRDQEQRKFAEEMGQTMKVLARFLETSHEHTQFLNKKAAHVEQYLNQR